MRRAIQQRHVPENENLRHRPSNLIWPVPVQPEKHVETPASRNSAHGYPYARMMYNEYMPPTLTYTLGTGLMFMTADALVHMPGIYNHDPRPNITIQDFITEAPQATMHLGKESGY